MSGYLSNDRQSYTPNQKSYTQQYSAPVTRQYVPLTCHGHSRPVTHLSFSSFVGANPEEYYMISACKDGNPMLRDGVTGDWIGTFFGHKGAVYQARLSPDASLAATASADFTAKVWDTHTGEVQYTLKHDHIVRAVAFPTNTNSLVATGGYDKQLRVFDLSLLRQNRDSTGQVISDVTADKAFVVGQDVHKGFIKAVVWTYDPNILVTAADDKIVRWWDLYNKSLIQELKVDGDIGSCEFNNVTGNQGIYDKTAIGEGMPVLSIAAGKTLYFYGGPDARKLLKSVVLPYEAASVALHVQQRKFVVGGAKENNTWAKVYDYDSEQEIDVHKGHHGPIWTISFSPDGKLYATGSEDGTIKMWKNCQGSFGLWKAEG